VNSLIVRWFAPVLLLGVWLESGCSPKAVPQAAAYPQTGTAQSAFTAVWGVVWANPPTSIEEFNRVAELLRFSGTGAERTVEDSLGTTTLRATMGFDRRLVVFDIEYAPRRRQHIDSSMLTEITKHFDAPTLTDPDVLEYSRGDIPNANDPAGTKKSEETIRVGLVDGAWVSSVKSISWLRPGFIPEPRP
jgi:hypothetical protein